MDVKRGWILEPPNLPAWRHFPVRDELADASALPVFYTNDANAAAYGEFWKGRAKNESSVVFLTLGTGIGGGIVVGGQLLEGATGNPAELGHIAIQYGPDARVCSCGQIGHLEAYASATAVSKRAAELAESNPGGRLGKLLASQQSLTARDVYEAACKNDADAELVISETAQYLARGVAIVANTIDPGIVVLGGAMDFGGDSSDVGRRFIDRIVTLAKQTTLKPISENLKVEFAELGSAAGWIGAAGLAKRLYDRS